MLTAFLYFLAAAYLAGTAYALKGFLDAAWGAADWEESPGSSRYPNLRDNPIPACLLAFVGACLWPLWVILEVL